MKRTLASLLLSVFGFALILPAFSDTDLPACCRRDGKHHCAMADMGDAASPDGSAIVSVPSRCPLYPNNALPAGFDATAASAAFMVVPESICERPNWQPIENHRGVIFDSSSQKRGPPVLLVS